MEAFMETGIKVRGKMGLFGNIRESILIASLNIRSLCYNSCRAKNYFIDAAFEPVYWFVDNVAGFMGLIFVILVTLLTASVVAIWYSYLLPVILTYDTIWIGLHVIIAHWLLINIVFHYFQAVFTNPGMPPQGTPMEKIGGAVVCRTCIQPKPPRTHHCSVCDKCFLKMDHHCPWMNNCIGFYNHRYFIMFCVFMWLGTLYVSLTTYDLFTYHFFHPGEILNQEKKQSSKLMFRFGFGGLIKQVLEHITPQGKDILKTYATEYRKHPGGWEDVHEYEHLAIIYLFLLCSAVTCALGLLNLWHIMLISQGQTSIEVHINRRERLKAAKRGMGYHSPYDYSWRQNWRNLLGLYHNRSWLCLIFPSAHPPQGDGISWPRNPKPVHYIAPYIQREGRLTVFFSKLRQFFRC